MIVRNDLKPNAAVVPEHLKDAILRVGGKNPYDEPLYRLLLAQDRITRAAGEWAIWADSVPAEDRGSLGIDDIQRMTTQMNEVIINFDVRRAGIDDCPNADLENE